MKDKIIVDINKQTLTVMGALNAKKSYLVSTGRNGPGETMHSECTPRGLHRVYSKIGGGAPENSVFVGRHWTGEIFDTTFKMQFPDRDWILTRIIRLAGMEDGLNRGNHVDTLKRYIYIHGTPSTTELGKPGSRGCVRMKNQDIIELFDTVSLNTAIEII